MVKIESQKETNPLKQRGALGIYETAFAAIGRLIPHPPNFAPVGALSLYSGARLKGWRAFIVPIVLMVITDLLIWLITGKSDWKIALVVYASLMINVALGRLLRNTESPFKIAPVTLIASVQFFITTNFGVWLLGSFYPHTAVGLLASYTAALPFFQYTFLGDAVFTTILFGAHHLLSRRVFPLERVESIPSIAAANH